MEIAKAKNENIKQTNDLKVKKDLLKVEVVESNKYVGSDWCATIK